MLTMAMNLTMQNAVVNQRSAQSADQPPLAVLLEFAETKVRYWLRSKYSHMLSYDDMEDVWAEVRIAVMRFQKPDAAEDWRPCFVGFLKQVTGRVFHRFVSKQSRCSSLEDMPYEPASEECDPTDNIETDLIERLAEEMAAIPALHAAALLLQLDSDVSERILMHGGPELVAQLGLPAVALVEACRRGPLSDAEIGALYQTTGRAVIAARQNARRRLRRKFEAYQ